MALPTEFLDELIARNDIVDVVSNYVHLTKKGSSYFGLCPFHSEKTGSFCVVPDKQIFYCFGCKKGGSVINFIMEEENLPFIDAARFLAKRAGMEFPENTGGQQQARQRKRLLELNRETARLYHQVLRQPEGSAVRAYLEKRQIQWKTAVRFGMGASPDQWTFLLDTMVKRGYSKEELLTAGLVVRSKNGRLYDKFRNRLMLPVIDTRGDVVAFGSRVLDKSEPKYMNSSETPVYSKRRVLYGLNLAKKTKRPNILLCEGNLDIVTLHQAGFDNAVASMGTALTEEQIRLLSHFTSELVLCYDNDNAGKIATRRALELLNNASLTVRVMQLPLQQKPDGEWGKQDADDFIKRFGPDAFERLLSGSENGLDFRMAQIAGRHDMSSDQDRIAYCAEVSELLAGLSNPVEQEIYAGRAAETARITPEAMKLEIQRTGRQLRAKAKHAELRRELNPAVRLQPDERSLHYTNMRSARAEEGLLRLLLLDDTLFPAEPPLREEEFSSPLLGRAFFLLWALRDEGHRPTLPALADTLTPAEMSHITAVCQQPESLKNSTQALADYIDTIHTEADRRNSTDADPLLTAMRNTRDKKKGNGGKQHDKKS